MSIENKDSRLYDNNYILKKISKKEFIEQQDYCYGVLKNSKMGLIEVFYEAKKVKDFKYLYLLEEQDKEVFDREELLNIYVKLKK